MAKIGPIAKLDGELTMTKFVAGLVAATVAIVTTVLTIKRDLALVMDNQAEGKMWREKTDKNLAEINAQLKNGIDVRVKDR